jgi:hypothetical protein
MQSDFSPLAVAYFSVLVGSFVILCLAAYGGFLLRKRLHPGPEGADDVGFIVNASLTLLGLIVAFTFAMAVNRYDLRKSYEEGEANAIGTAYVRAQLLPAANASNVQALLSAYLAQRISFYRAENEEQLQRANNEGVRLQTELWSAVAAPAVQQPTAVRALVVASMNDVLNAQGYAQAAFWNRVPISAWLLMLALAAFCNGLVGYHVRFANVGTLLILPTIFCVAFFLIADIDSPRRGLIRVQPQNLTSLGQALHAQVPTSAYSARH